MGMAGLKTVATKASVAAFLAKVTPAGRRTDAKKVVAKSYAYMKKKYT